MVIRKRMMVWLGASVLLPSLSHALTVGQLQVRSALGEPFEAELVVSELGSTDPKNLEASLANDSDFNQLGIQRDQYSAGLQVSHRIDARGRMIVSVRSNKPLTDPFLDVVVKIKDGSNTRLQHLTALVEIPKTRQANPLPNLPSVDHRFTALAVTPVQQMPSMPQSRKPAEAAPLRANQDTPLIPINAEPPALNMPIPLPEPILSVEQQARAPRYTVQRNDSLWRIASQLQRSHQRPVGQLMSQIRQLNPTAFVRGDPNQLKQDANLILPPLPVAQDLLTQQPAIEKIQPKPAAPAAKPITPSKPVAAVTRRGRLPAAEMILLAPNQAGLAAGNTTQTGRTAGVQPFSRDLLQRVGQARRHTASLRQEVIELDAQVTANDQKIAMQNAKIAELQQRLKARREAQRLAQSGKTTVLPTIAFTALALLSSAMLGIQPVYAEATTAAAAAEPAASGSGGMMWIIIVVAVLIVAAIAVMVLKKKDKPAAPAAKPQARPEAAQPRPVSKATPVAPASPKAATPVPVAKAATPAPVAKIATPAPVPAKTPTPAPVVSQPVVAEQPKDPLVDAQAFISMERYPQAVGILSKAIDQQPERSDLYLALLEIYLLQEDHDAFETLQARLDALEDPMASDQALQLQSRLSPRPVVIPKDDDQPLTFTKVEIPREQPTEQPVVSASADDHPLEFSLDKPISDGASPALEIGQDDDRAFQLDTPFDAAQVESLDSLEAEFKATGTRPSLTALTEESVTEAPLSDLDFDFSVKNLQTTTDETDHSVLSDALSDLKAFSLEEPASSAAKTDQPVDLDFDFEASSFELEDDKASKTAETGNLAAGFDDLDFTLPEDDQLKPLEEATSLSLDDLSLVTPDHALDDQASQFDALLEQSTGDAPVTSDSQRLTSQLAAEFPFLADAEDQATNLELAQRYASLGEISSAHELLDEVLALGSDAQKDHARQLKAKLAS